jgi:SapC
MDDSEGRGMATQLMIYETAIPVSHARHANWSVEVGTSYVFCENVNSVPLMAAEFASAAAEYVIVFGGTGDAVMPAAVLGVRPDQNVYVTSEGGWQAKYLPAFVRRYPFVFAPRDDGGTLTLCIDEAFPGFNRNGRGQRLFGDDGKPTGYVGNVLKFLQQFQSEFQHTQALCRKLKELNLFQSMQAQINLGSGERMALGGFSVVNRGLLKTLSAEVLAQMMKADELELIYTHLLSL